LGTLLLIASLQESAAVKILNAKVIGGRIELPSGTAARLRDLAGETGRLRRFPATP